MRAEVVTVDVTVGCLNDGDRTVVLCTHEDFPEFVGRGPTETEAAADLFEQIGSITWH